MKAEVATRTLVYERWLRLWRTELHMPDGSTAERHVEDHGSAVAVLPYDPERRTALLVRQPRAAVLMAGETPIVELIAGLDDGEAPEDAARREAMEEAGVALGALEPVARLWTMPGISTERMWIFLARYGEADRVAAGGGAAGENEAIEVFEMPLASLAAAARGGTLPDAKTLVAVQALMLARPELFGR